MSWLSKLTEKHLLIVGLALVGGVVFTNEIINFSYLSTWFLGLIFFFSSLKIDLKKVGQYLHDPYMLIVVNLMMLIVLPIIVFLVMNFVFPSLALAFLLLAVMPSGMTSPLLSEISGGNQGLALVLAVTTSLLAPLTVPFVIKFMVGTTVAVSFADMFYLLAIVIYVPFILAQIVKYLWNDLVIKIEPELKPVSVLLLGLLILVVVSKQAMTIMEGFSQGGIAFIYLGALFLFFIVLHVIGYFAVFWKKMEDRLTIVVCLTYMNFTLAIELANNFFTEPNVIIPVVLAVIPWSLMFVPYKYWVGRALNN
jgi:BASS family bile acid:Na+ symporter